MATDDASTLIADDNGVWRVDPDGNRFGIAWDEIHAVSGAQLDCFTEYRSYIELDFENGHFLELYEDWPGFDSLLPAIAARFGFADDWFSPVPIMAPGDDPIVIWRHS